MMGGERSRKIEMGSYFVSWSRLEDSKEACLRSKSKYRYMYALPCRVLTFYVRIKPLYTSRGQPKYLDVPAGGGEEGVGEADV